MSGDRTTRAAALWCDEYELTMAQSFWRNGQSDQHVCFELFVRSLPHNRGYLVAAGLEPVLDYLEDLHFSPDDCAFLRRQGLLTPEFIEHLSNMNFTGDICAIAEGTVVGAGVPLLQVVATREHATLIESAVLALVNHQTTIATKAARIVDAAKGRPVWDFSMRRLHGLGPAVGAARAAYIGGCAGTATVAAGSALDIPTTGTMAHHYVQAFGEDGEQAAFEQFLRDFPKRGVLLVDTYETARGVQRAIAASRATGVALTGVRIDSGDLREVAASTRVALDGAGMSDTAIIASNDLDEYRIAQLLAEGAPIDTFGVGTMLGVSADAPALGGVYKLVAQERGGTMEPVMKRSPGKATDPGVHQVWREEQALVVGLADELGERTALLAPVMQAGKRCTPTRPLKEVRDACVSSVAQLSEPVRRFVGPAAVEVRQSPALLALRQSVMPTTEPV